MINCRLANMKPTLLSYLGTINLIKNFQSKHALMGIESREINYILFFIIFTLSLTKDVAEFWLICFLTCPI